MSTNFSSRKEAQQYQFVSHIVYDLPAIIKDGKVVQPVTYHTEVIPQPDRKVTILTESREGQVTAGFHGTGRKHLSPLPVRYRKWQLIDGSAMTHIYVPGSSTAPPTDTYSYTSPIAHSSGYVLSNNEILSLERKAITGLRNRAKDMSFNAAQAYAERHQTANLVANTAQTLAKSIRSLRKGDILGAARALGVKPSRKVRKSSKVSVTTDNISRRWLELEYGWKPLLQDVHGAAEALAKSNNNVQFTRVTKVQSAEAHDDRTVKQSLNTGDTGFDKTRYKTDDKLVIRYGVKFSQQSPVTDLQKMGLTNPALLAWELLPFSFVADWFVPIGSFLSSLDATLGLRFESGYKTVFRTINTEMTSEAMVNYRTGGYLSRYEHASSKLIEWDRTVLSDFPSAVLPVMKNPFSVTHAANAIALLHQLFKR